MSTEQLFFNGIDGATGDYLLPPMTTEQVLKMAQGEEFDPAHLGELKKKNDQVKGLDTEFAPIEGVDPKNLAETGWGVIFPAETAPGQTTGPGRHPGSARRTVGTSKTASDAEERALLSGIRRGKGISPEQVEEPLSRAARRRTRSRRSEQDALLFVDRR